jgi:hypothetical protein
VILKDQQVHSCKRVFLHVCLSLLVVLKDQRVCFYKMNNLQGTKNENPEKLASQVAKVDK